MLTGRCSQVSLVREHRPARILEIVCRTVLLEEWIKSWKSKNLTTKFSFSLDTITQILDRSFEFIRV
jgi:hypothetical protein